MNRLITYSTNFFFSSDCCTFAVLFEAVKYIYRLKSIVYSFVSMRGFLCV